MGLITAFRKCSTEFMLYYALPCSGKAEEAPYNRKAGRLLGQLFSFLCLSLLFCKMRITLLSCFVRLFERKKSWGRWGRRYIFILSDLLWNKCSAGTSRGSNRVCYPSFYSLLLPTETKTKEGGRLMLGKSLHTLSFGKRPLLFSSASSPLDKPSQLGINKVPCGNLGCSSGAGYAAVPHEAPAVKCFAWRLAPVTWKQTPAIRMPDIKHGFLSLSATQETDESKNPLFPTWK